MICPKADNGMMSVSPGCRIATFSIPETRSRKASDPDEDGGNNGIPASLKMGRMV
jgi:hypothetical protein